MSLPDTIFILLAALLLFGPKKLPEIARQVGKLMAELRRAGNEFKFQMEDELRQAEEADRRKKAEDAAAAATAAASAATAAANAASSAAAAATAAVSTAAQEAATPVSTEPAPPAPSLTLELPETGAPVANHVSSRAAHLTPELFTPNLFPPAADSASGPEPPAEASPDASAKAGA
jgi:sec-independent protein translocase protein TatB